MNEALLPPGTSAQAKCTYRETYPTIDAHLRWEAFLKLKRTITAIHCTAWTSFTGETYTILQTDHDDNNDSNNYEDYEEYDDILENNYYGKSQFANYIKDFRLQWH